MYTICFNLIGKGRKNCIILLNNHDICQISNAPVKVEFNRQLIDNKKTIKMPSQSEIVKFLHLNIIIKLFS